MANYQDPWARCWRMDDLDEGRGARAAVEEFDESSVFKNTKRWHFIIGGRGHGYPTRPFGRLIASANGIAIEAVPGAHPGYEVHPEQ